MAIQPYIITPSHDNIHEISLGAYLVAVCPFPNQENQVAHDVQQYKLKPAENGQPEHKTQLEEISLALGWVYTYSNINMCTCMHIAH